jgi:hypothetical protein
MPITTKTKTPALQLSNTILLSIKEYKNGKSKSVVHYISLTEDEYNQCPESSSKKKTESGEYLIGCHLVENESSPEALQFHSYTAKLAFKPYDFQGKKGMSAHLLLIKDNGDQEAEFKAKQEEKRKQLVQDLFS